MAKALEVAVADNNIEETEEEIGQGQTEEVSVAEAMTTEAVKAMPHQECAETSTTPEGAGSVTTADSVTRRAELVETTKVEEMVEEVVASRSPRSHHSKLVRRWPLVSQYQSWSTTSE